jgi:hypothetical protein
VAAHAALEVVFFGAPEGFEDGVIWTVDEVEFRVGDGGGLGVVVGRAVFEVGDKDFETLCEELWVVIGSLVVVDLDGFGGSAVEVGASGPNAKQVVKNGQESLCQATGDQYFQRLSRVTIGVGRLNEYRLLEEKFTLVIRRSSTNEHVNPNTRPNVDADRLLGIANSSGVYENV